MPSQLWQDFCGSFYQTLWPIMGSDQAINVYQETREIPGSPKQTWMFGTPGLKFNATISGPNRGWFSQDGRTFTVGGSTLYEKTGPALYSTLGTIPDDGFPVSFASNGQGGNQLAIAGGGQINVLNLTTNLLTTASLPFSHPVMIVFQDGYGLVNERDTPKVWFSAIEDFTMWDGLDFFARSGSADNLVGLAITRDRLMVIGSKTTTLYYDSGDADNPWLPYPGTTTQVGAVAWPTISVYNDVIRFIGRSPKGEPRIVQMKADMNVQTISTPPINDVLMNASTLADAEALTYEQGGHAFVVWTMPSAADSVPLGSIQSFGYDVIESTLRQAPVWHARAGFNTSTGMYFRWRARGSTADGQDVLVGDYNTGDVYTLDLHTYQDNGVTLVRERIAPFLSANNQWVFFDQAELGMQPGVGLTSGQGSDPVVEFLLSRDWGQTWISAGLGSLGALGVYTARAIWRRLGRLRQDRLAMRVRQTDPVPCVWGPGLWLTFTQGTGQL